MATAATSKINDCFGKSSIEIIAVKPDFVFNQNDVDSLIYASARKSLCFDEDVPMYILLHFPPDSEAQFSKDLAYRIGLLVEAILSDGSQDRTSAPPRLVRQDSYSGKNRPDQGQVIYSKNIEPSISPVMCRAKDHYVAVWTHTTSLPFTRTRTRSELPRVSCNVILTLNDSGPLDTLTDEGDAYVEESTATSRDKNYNLLRALEHDFSLSKNPPKLPVSRVSALAPLIDSSSRKPKKSAKRLFPISSVVDIRIRVFEIPHTSRLILSADLSVAANNTYAVCIDSVILQVAAIKIPHISATHFPVRLANKGSFTFSFEVEHEWRPSAVTSMPAQLLVRSIPMMYGTEHTANPLVTSKWNTNINLANDIQPTMMVRSTSKPLTRGPPPTVQRSTSSAMVRRVSTMSNSSADVSSRPGHAGPNSLAGLQITIRNPSTGHVGQTLAIEITISNDSQATKTLAIEVSRNARRKGLPQIPKLDNQSLVLTNSELSAIHAFHAPDSMDFICLSNNIKLSPLSPDARHDTQLKYLPMTRGTFALQDVRIVDVTNGVYQELRQLPSILILP